MWAVLIVGVVVIDCGLVDEFTTLEVIYTESSFTLIPFVYHLFAGLRIGGISTV